MVGSKYKDSDREEALAMLATGMKVSEVSRIKGIPKQTISNWKCRAEEEDEDFRAQREMEKRKVVEMAWKICRDAYGIVGGQVKAAKKSQAEVNKICGAIFASGHVDEFTAKAMERIVREHYGMSTKDALSVLNTMMEQGENIRRSMGDAEGGQTMLVEFAGAEDWAG